MQICQTWTSCPNENFIFLLTRCRFVRLKVPFSRGTFFEVVPIGQQTWSFSSDENLSRFLRRCSLVRPEVPCPMRIFSHLLQRCPLVGSEDQRVRRKHVLLLDGMLGSSHLSHGKIPYLVFKNKFHYLKDMKLRSSLLEQNNFYFQWATLKQYLSFGLILPYLTVNSHSRTYCKLCKFHEQQQ